MSEKNYHSAKDIKVFLIDIVTDSLDEEHLNYRMIELENLTSTYGGLVVLKKIQKRTVPDYNTYIGSWKLEEIKEEMKEHWANLLIVWNILKPGQIYQIDRVLREIWAQARDMVDLILKIFQKNAKSVEAKLQIELASIKHMWPRIFGMGMDMSRQWWWSKLARWLGETNTEIMKRHLKEKQIKIKNKLEEYKKTRKLHRENRLSHNLPTVGIVWYTNAGKSSLLNALTHKWVLSEDKLFATLGTSVGKMYIPIDEMSWKEVLLNDTIWFIRNLPPSLIDAFSSTLEDSIQSQILLHVIDSSDPEIEDKFEAVEKILKEIWANQKRIYVFNKIDLIDDVKKAYIAWKFKRFKPIFVSSQDKIWFDKLNQRILKYL